jgi:predicted nuclease of predicted toxin-antitoxin system
LKLLVDENLPPRIVLELDDLFPDSLHVRAAGLGSNSDEVIWDYAKTGSFAF